MWGVDVGDPTSSSGLATNVRRSNGSSPIATQRVQPGEEPGLHVGHTRTGRDVAVEAERPSGRGARLEHGVHVADEQDPCATGPSLEGAEHGAAEASVGIGPVLDPGAEALQEPARPAPDLVDPGGDVAAAVDVHQVLEVGEEGRQLAFDGGAQGSEVSVGRTGRDGHRGQSSPLAILPGPCA